MPLLRRVARVAAVGAVAGGAAGAVQHRQQGRWAQQEEQQMAAQQQQQMAAAPPPPEEDPMEKLKVLHMLDGPALKPGKFRVPDRLMATLKSATIMRPPANAGP